MGAAAAAISAGGPQQARLNAVSPADSQIIEGLRNRNDAALELLFEKYGRLITHWARSEGQDSEDVVQDVLFKVWRAAPKLRPDTHLPAWLKTVTTNTVRNRWRTRERRPSVPVGLDIDGAATDPISGETERIAVEQALELLQPRERECLELLYVSDMPLADVAERLGTSREAAKSLAARARRRIRSELESVNRGAAAAAGLPMGLLEFLQTAGHSVAAKAVTTAVAVLTAGALTVGGGAGTDTPQEPVAITSASAQVVTPETEVASAASGSRHEAAAADADVAGSQQAAPPAPAQGRPLADAKSGEVGEPNVDTGPKADKPGAPSGKPCQKENQGQDGNGNKPDGAGPDGESNRRNGSNNPGNKGPNHLVPAGENPDPPHNKGPVHSPAPGCV